MLQPVLHIAGLHPARCPSRASRAGKNPLSEQRRATLCDAHSSFCPSFLKGQPPEMRPLLPSFCVQPRAERGHRGAEPGATVPRCHRALWGIARHPRGRRLHQAGCDPSDFCAPLAAESCHEPLADAVSAGRASLPCPCPGFRMAPKALLGEDTQWVVALGGQGKLQSSVARSRFGSSSTGACGAHRLGAPAALFTPAEGWGSPV